MFFLDYDTFPLEDIFNRKLIDCLPGIFYLYEVIDDGYYMKVWNRNHVLITGYTDEESLDKPPLYYVDDKSKPAIIEGVKKVLTTGYVKNVYGNLRTKDGTSIPFVFEGYKFHVKNREFFMGLGIDISDLANARKELKKLNALRLKKEKQLLAEVLKTQQKEELLQAIANKLDTLLQQKEDKGILTAIEQLHSKIQSHYQFEDQWSSFEATFKSIHQNFFSELKKNHPNLSKSELQYCAYIKINMSSEQIRGVLHISKEGIKKKRYRLAKKFNLKETKQLDSYIQNF